MTCKYCYEKSGVYDMTLTCCAVRFILSVANDPEKTAQAISIKYCHAIEDLRAEAKRQRKAQA